MRTYNAAHVEDSPHVEISITSLAIVAAVGFTTPLLLGLVRKLHLPSVVLEIVLGIVIGPSLLTGQRGMNPSRWSHCAVARKRETEPRAAFRARLGPDLAALGLDQPARDRQPEPGSGFAGGPRGVAAPEALEHSPLCRGREAVAVVLDRDL
jgi:hypothetical protein